MMNKYDYDHKIIEKNGHSIMLRVNKNDEN